MTTCETTNFTFPMIADIFYPIVEQGVYGSLSKTWIHDRTAACSLTPAGAASKEEVTPNIQIKQDSVILGRFRTDPRISVSDSNNSITNIIVTNIKDRFSKEVYVETAGPRAGKSTIFEVATIEPYTGPFGSIEFYKVILRRSENQAVDI